jgi:DNA-binding NarL/FixJ family response regulator
MARAYPPFDVLIVDDEVLLLLSLSLIIEQNAEFRVVGRASDLNEALRCAARRRPHLALVDLRLANDESGLDVARALRRRGVSSLLMSSNAPRFPLPDLAIGCLSKPFRDESLLASLRIARALATGDVLPRYLPDELELYDA